MSRSSRARLGDILAACAAIEDYASRADDDPIVFDAIRIRLVEIGEAVNDLDPSITTTRPDIPWVEIARMRDQLAHRYFDTTHAIVMTTALRDVPLLKAAARQLLDTDADGWRLAGCPRGSRPEPHAAANPGERYPAATFLPVAPTKPSPPGMSPA